MPARARKQTREAYRLFRSDPDHPGLRFKQVHPTPTIYSARVGLRYRALGTLDGDKIVWFWVGPHAEYDKILSRL